MRRYLALFALAVVMLALPQSSEASGGHRRGGGLTRGKYVTYNGATFTATPVAVARTRRLRAVSPRVPSYLSYAPAAPGGGFPMMMGR